MKLLYKRILIIFSVALNIGFLIMAGTMFLNHNGKSREMSKIEELVHSLSLTEPQENGLMEGIHKFKSVLENQDAKINLIRTDIVALASKPGPLDEHQLQQLNDALDQEEIKKNALFNTHVIDLRTALGNEKGAQFYSLLLEHIKNIHKTHRR